MTQHSCVMSFIIILAESLGYYLNTIMEKGPFVVSPVHKYAEG